MRSESSLPEDIVQWLARLTGLPEPTFTGLSLEQKVGEIARWYASKVVAEQAGVLLCALALVEDNVAENDLAKLFGLPALRDTPLGAFNFVCGVCEQPHLAAKTSLPLLQRNAYRPFLRKEVANAILGLCGDGDVAASGLSADKIADTILRECLSPTSAMRLLKTMRDFAKRDAKAMPRLLRSLMEARSAAAGVIADQPEVETIIGRIAPPED